METPPPRRARPCSTVLLGAASLALLGAVGAAAAQPVPDPAFGWSTIGDPGNRGLNSTEAPFLSDRPNTGRVDYAFRMTTTEVTNAQYIEFVRAYKPFQQEIGSLNDPSYTGWDIGYQSSIDDFSVSDSLLNAPATTSWRYAARMINWISNGRVNERWAFETGVYDTSTFGRDPDTNALLDQPEHSPGAKYWLPTLDEWTKAMYWDPAKNDGEGGYWQYPTSSDEVPVSGLPGVGETNAGTLVKLPVGSYPGVTSPWGLLDGSGGDDEWLETLSGSARMLKGSSYSTPLLGVASSDTVNHFNAGNPENPVASFRIVTVIPSVSTSCVYMCVLTLSLMRRRR